MASQYVIDLAFPDDYSRDKFEVSTCNDEAFRLIESFPNWHAYGAVLIGEKSSGKTHLANIWAKSAKAVSMNEIDPLAPLAGNILIDDADCKNEEHVFHILNNTKLSSNYTLLTSSKPVSEWVKLKDLASRLKSLPTARLEKPDEGVLISVMRKYFLQQQVEVSPDVYSFVVKRMERSFFSALTVSKQLNKLAFSEKRPISVHLARKLFNE